MFKKKGLLAATSTSNGVAGEGYAYLKNWTWWCGMTLMVVGEVCNFVAYAFTEAILVTPLGALSVVVAAIGSSIFLKERLSFIGKVGCFLCILGAVIIVLNSPDQPSASTIQEMRHFVISKVFLPYMAIIFTIALFLIFWVGPRYGKTNVFVYISICSIVGGISVVCTQGFGASVVSAISGVPNQWNNWFLWVLLLLVICTLGVEIVFLNKALNLFNTSVVTPIYFTYFTTMTLVSSAVLFRGFNGSATSIITVVLGFLCIVAGVVLLQVSLAAQNKSDSQLLKAELNDVQDVLHTAVDDDTLNPGPASIRGALSVRRFTIRNVSSTEQVDALRRRQTISSAGSGSVRRSAYPVPQHSQYSSSGTGNGHADHRTITFANQATGHSGTEKTGYAYVQPSSFSEFPPVTSHSKDEHLPRIYASEMNRNTSQQSEDMPRRPLSEKSSTNTGLAAGIPRMKKQFSFAVRGSAVQSEEERVGLTTGDDGSRIAMHRYSSQPASRSDSENSDDEVHRAI